MAGFRCFWACRESFVPVGPGGGCCGESFVPGEWWIGVGSGRKFSLLGGVVLEAGENSPCSREMAGFRCFWACWESFVPVEPGGGCCWESFVPGEWWIGVGSGRKFSLLARNGRISVFLGVPGEFCTGWARAWNSLGAGLLCGAPLARKSADDGLLFGHTDDAGALAQGQGRGHGHGAGAAREHEDNQHVFGAHGQDWGDAGGQADGREC